MAASALCNLRLRVNFWLKSARKTNGKNGNMRDAMKTSKCEVVDQEAECHQMPNRLIVWLKT